jgi:hypothetical protein
MLFGLVEGKKYVVFDMDEPITPPIEFLGYKMFENRGISVSFHGYWWELYDIVSDNLRKNFSGHVSFGIED